MAKKTKFLPLALGIGFGAAVLFWATKSKAAVIPPGLPPTGPDQPTPDPGDPAPGTGGGGGGGVAKRQPAEPFPFTTTDQAEIAGVAAVLEPHSAWMLAVNSAMEDNDDPGPEPSQAAVNSARFDLEIPEGKSIAAWLTDLAYHSLYSTGTIPGIDARGPGWAPYVKSWKFMFDFAKSQVWT